MDLLANSFTFGFVCGTRYTYQLGEIAGIGRTDDAATLE